MILQFPSEHLSLHFIIPLHFLHWREKGTLFIISAHDLMGGCMHFMNEA